MTKTYVVAGAGFKGFCDCLELLKQPDCKVYMVDPAPFFGGVIYSSEVHGFNVDKGVHVFDSIPVDLADVITEIMGGAVKEIDFVSESAFNGKVTQGYSLPDLSSMDDCNIKDAITAELVKLASEDHSNDHFRTLRELFDGRYGKTAGSIFSKIFENIYHVEPNELEAKALSQTSMGRMKHLSDEEMLVLKSHSWLDTVLAARRKSLKVKVDDFVSIYPDTGEAMRGWCERTTQWLQKKGVELCLGESVVKITENSGKAVVKTTKREICADKVIWANDNVKALSSAMGFECDLSDYQHRTSLVLMTMITEADKIKDFTYLQNFDPEAVNYRIASAGIFSGQVKEDGTSFITCECPVELNSEDWNNAEALAGRAWQECKHLGIVSQDATLVHLDIAKIPVAFKLPKLGYSEQLDKFRDDVSLRSKNVLFRDVTPFYRREIYLDSLEIGSLL
ncbi:NAD(P)-binding protein [Thalassospira tepidiphila]|jgi:protoporphyrinogen oxidase|uniref:NAD(P)-binding protein n=1 Tax=Thalassospira tepidiphila TaxID=393657 RepID=UPI0029223D2C|nr:hypothetical protein MACH01_31190 [Thalassospira tepidiphila]